jgi:hypothetical protein
MALLTRPLAWRAATISAAALAFRAFASTEVLTNMDSFVAANFKIATA